MRSRPARAPLAPLPRVRVNDVNLDAARRAVRAQPLVRAAVLTAASLVLFVACGTTSIASAPTPVPRCASGRPQQEIDLALAKAAPFEARSPAITCVLNAVSELPSYDRAYLLTDGRQLHIYERTTALPAKPVQPPLATGTVAVGSVQWQFAVLDFPAPVIEIRLERSDLYIELDVRMTDREKDLALLTAIVSEWHVR